MRRPSALHFAFLATAAFGVAAAFVQACSYDWQLPGDICDDREAAACAKEPIKTRCSGTQGCVQCLADSDCSGGTPVCNKATYTCANCSESADCVERQSPGGNACNTETGKCVECIDDEDCAGSLSGRACVVGLDVKTCGCATNADCAGSQFGSRCDVGYCVCDDDADCAHPAAFSSTCVTSVALCGCTADFDCESGSCVGADCPDFSDTFHCKLGTCKESSGAGGGASSTSSSGSATGAGGAGL